jgi:hypothetical protein
MTLTRRAAVGLVAAASLAAATPPTLAQYTDHSRVVVMFAPTADDARFAAQSAQLAALSKQPTFQSLIVAGVAGETVVGLSDTAAALRRRFAVTPNAFAVLLIGKDGHVALRRNTVTPAQTLATTIDAMPMRQEELKRGEAN